MSKQSDKTAGAIQMPWRLCCYCAAFLLAAGSSLFASPSRNYQPRPGENLTTLLPSCDPANGATCNDDVFQKVWLKLVADNGEITKVDMNQTGRNNLGGAETLIYTYVANTPYDSSKMHRLIFDCHGRFEDISNGGSGLIDVTPNSIIGHVAVLACSKPFPR